MTDVPAGLQYERTTLAWQRTGLTHLAFAGILVRLLPMSAWSFTLGALLGLSGVVAVAVGSRSQLQASRRKVMLLMAGAAVGAAVLALIGGHQGAAT